MRHKFKPYIRRANGCEKSESLRVALRLAAYQLTGQPFYVLVQRGFPRLAIEVGHSRSAIVRTIIGAHFGGFNAWANRLKRRAQGAK
jgi:hypothetical protein